jgi:predicted O-linked N-acetylglucosamine transferase (SPINDLY family)
MREVDTTSAALRMTRMQPGSADAWSTLGQALIEARRIHSAPRCFARATQLEPHNPVHWARLGKVLLALRRYKAAQDALRQACAIAPGSAQWQILLGHVLREQNDMDGAFAAYARARQAEPGNLHAAVGEALLLPSIYRDMAELMQWRSRFEGGLLRLHAEWPKHPGWANQILGLEWENFALAYQGRDDRALQESYADFVANLLARAAPNLQSLVAQVLPRGRRIRVGFLSSELRTCTIGDYFSSWILDLPRDRFEVRSYFTGHLPDELTARLAAGCDRFETLTGAIDTVAAHVRRDPPDLLIFPDIGATTPSSLLANLRLAPIQCAAWGHPVTTGSRYIDWYFSCAAMEPAAAATHYREKLILLPGLGVRYARPAEPAVRTRSHFGLPEDAHIYVCPNRLQKILPDRDPSLLDIMTQDPQAVLVFFDAVAPGQREAFIERLLGAMRARGIAPRKQIKFLPLLSHAEFRSALAVADVMLDTANFSAGSSALDALAVGLPIIAKEGRFMRGRQSAAMLRMVGVPELVADNEQRYVEAALRVARDHALRSSLSARIKAGLPRLFDCSEPLAAFAAALERIVL